MAMHNFKQSHRITKPCRICKADTAALVKGVMQLHPVCESCSLELAEQFYLAQKQREAQFNRSRKGVR